MRKLLFVILIIGITCYYSSYSFARQGELLQEFKNPTPEKYDAFGSSIAVLGNKVIIGAQNDDTLAGNAGAVYIYDGTSGELLQSIYSPNPHFRGLFGTSIETIGDDFIVGAAGDNTHAPGAGAAYLFDGATGELLRSFYHPNPERDDNFGYDITAYGNNIIIGSSGDDTTNINAGAAFLYDTQSGDLLQTYVHQSPHDGSLSSTGFGSTIATLGDMVLLGARFDNTSGAAYLYDGILGNLLRIIEDPTPHPDGIGDMFGTKVVSTDSFYLISDDDDDTRGSIHQYDAVTGNLLYSFNNPSPNEADQFGQSLAVVGSNILISATGDNTVAPGGIVYSYNDLTKQIDATYTHPDPYHNDSFGAIIMPMGDNVLITSVGDDDNCFGGDINCDAKVDLYDLDQLGIYFRQITNQWSHGDFNGDGIVGLLDLDILGKHYGEERVDTGSVFLFSGIEQPITTPEPGSLFILLILAEFGLIRRY